MAQPETPQTPRKSSAAPPTQVTPVGPPQIGTVVRLTREMGFGFILSLDKIEYFFHFSCCVGGKQGQTWNELDKGDEVRFTPATSDKGPRAIDVVLSDLGVNPVEGF